MHCLHVPGVPVHRRVGSTWPVEVWGPVALLPWPRGCNGLRGHGHRAPTRSRARQQPARDRAVARGAAHEPSSAHLLLILRVIRGNVRHRGAWRPSPTQEVHPQMRAVLVQLHHHREDLSNRAKGRSNAGRRTWPLGASLRTCSSLVAAWVCRRRCNAWTWPRTARERVGCCQAHSNRCAATVSRKPCTKASISHGLDRDVRLAPPVTSPLC